MDTSSEVAALRALYDTYFDAWNRQDLDTYCSLFAFPIIVGGGGREPLAVPDLAAWRERTRSNLDALTARGWALSTFDTLHVGLMAGDTGVLTVHYAREDSEGAQIEAGTSNYLTRKLGGEWKIVGIIAP